MIEIPRAFKPLFHPKRYKVLYGGRGSAKSTSIALTLLTLGAQSKKRILCAREIQNSIADSVHKLLKDLIDKHQEFKGYEVTQNIIRHKNGTGFIFKGLHHNITDIKSTEGVDICWVEEAHKVSSASWDVLVPTIRGENSEIWLSFNPEFEDDPTYQRFVIQADENHYVRKINYDENPFFTDVLRQEMERDKQRDYNNYLHVWEGEFKKTTDSAIFKNWKVEEFDTPKDAQLLFGNDWGFATDPTVLLRLFIIGRKIYIDYEAFGYQCVIEDTPALFETIPKSKEHVIRSDNARPEMINYMQRQGYSTVSVEKWAGSVEDGIDFIKGYDVIIHPRCKNITNEFAKYSYKTHKLTGDVLPDIVDAFNHGIDSLRYALQPLIKNSFTDYASLL